MEFGNMRDFSEFCEQLHEIRLKFHKWDSCERTVALYYLMTGLPFPNARFLQYALEQCIYSAKTREAEQLERNANDPSYVTSFTLENPQITMSLLLTHLPLLRPGNKECSDSYLNIIRKVLNESLSPPYKIYNECVEIMSYIFIHPAFSKEEKKSFKYLLKRVVNRVNPDNFIHSPVNESSDESVSPNSDFVNVKPRSNSLTPCHNNAVENLFPTYDLWSSQENITKAQQKQRSFSLSNDTSFINNFSTLQSSSSETRLQDLQNQSNQPIIKSIVSWLKSLRLHKYSWVFNNLNYEQMLNLTDETLQSIGITKGARHKILLSINKLKERSCMLTDLESEIMNGADLNTALKKIKTVLQSPLQITNGEDLPSQIIRVMGKVCTQLLMIRQPSEEFIVLFNGLCERVETIDAFNSEQRKRLNMWKSQLSNGTNNLPMYNQHRPHNNVNNHRSFNTMQHIMPANIMTQTPESFYHQKSSSFPSIQSNSSLTTHRNSVGSIQLQNQLYSVPPPTIILNRNENKTISAPPNKTKNGHHVRFQEHKQNYCDGKGNDQSNADIENSLESLCLQMMEHALGP